MSCPLVIPSFQSTGLSTFLGTYPQVYPHLEFPVFGYLCLPWCLFFQYLWAYFFDAVENLLAHFLASHFPHPGHYRGVVACVDLCDAWVAESHMVLGDVPDRHARLRHWSVAFMASHIVYSHFCHARDCLLNCGDADWCWCFHVLFRDETL